MDPIALPSALVLTTGLSLAALGAPGAADELLANPHLTEVNADGAPVAWLPWEPAWEPARCTVRVNDDGCVVEAPTRPYGVGGVEQSIEGIEGGRAYALEAECEIRRIGNPARSVVVRVLWLRQGAPLHPGGRLVRGPVVDGDEVTFGEVLVAPDDADGARVRLEVRWPKGGRVTWKLVSLTPAPMPAARTARIGTVYLRPSNSTPERNMELWCEQIAEAGRLGLDAICLGEAILMVGTSQGYAGVAEPIPGPSTERLGRAAREAGTWVVAGLMEREGDTLYNTAVLLDRQGRLAGRYRKTHLPREEWWEGVTPGTEYPVFETDFGTVAIQICYDWFFPEPAALFAANGAEILFAPTWGNTLPDWDDVADGETVFRVRARDNGLFIVPCVYDGNSMVMDPMGRILASSANGDTLVWAEIDLDAHEPLPWVGNWRAIGPRDRMPETYGPLVEPKDD